jgi:hypothetical protein
MGVLVGYLIYWAAAAIIGGIVALGCGFVLLISPKLKSLIDSPKIIKSKKPIREKELRCLEV